MRTARRRPCCALYFQRQEGHPARRNLQRVRRRRPRKPHERVSCEPERAPEIHPGAVGGVSGQAQEPLEGPRAQAALLYGAVSYRHPPVALFRRRRPLPGHGRAGPHRRRMGALHRILNLGHIPWRAPSAVRDRAGTQRRLHPFHDIDLRRERQAAGVGAVRLGDRLHDRLQFGARHSRRSRPRHHRIRRGEGVRGHGGEFAEARIRHGKLPPQRPGAG